MSEGAVLPIASVAPRMEKEVQGWMSRFELHGGYVVRSRMRFGIFFTFLFLILAGSWADAWQTKAPATSSAPGISQGKTTPRTDNPATLAQLMQGIMFPNSNVIFASQSKKFTTIAPARDPSAATDPLQGTYGSWQAVENSSLAIVEAANLLNAPGRRCSNGRPVPTAKP